MPETSTLQHHWIAHSTWEFLLNCCQTNTNVIFICYFQSEFTLLALSLGNPSLRSETEGRTNKKKWVWAKRCVMRGGAQWEPGWEVRWEEAGTEKYGALNNEKISSPLTPVSSMTYCLCQQSSVCMFPFVIVARWNVKLHGQSQIVFFRWHSAWDFANINVLWAQSGKLKYVVYWIVLCLSSVIPDSRVEVNESK